MSKKDVQDQDPRARSEGTSAEAEDIEFENEFIEETGIQNKLQKLRNELKEAKAQSSEYLTGWQKERADFANFKAEEEKKRQERLSAMKTNLIADFFPVLDSFDMAFSNKETWEKVDQNWRTGIEYIHTQFMNTLDQYGISVIDQEQVEFDPMIHEPSDTVSVEDESGDNKIIKIIQKGYKAGDMVIRPAKVHVGKYES